MADSFDTFLTRQKARCYEKAAASLTRLRKARKEAAVLAPEVLTIRGGGCGGGPSPRIHHDDGIEWFVRLGVNR
jgi:hypothetical protein